MFYHNFKYAFKTLFRDKMLIFWTFAFPIILGTFFNMAFSNIENSEKLDIISIAIVEKEENEIMKQAFETLSDEENEDRLFQTQYESEERAKELLENDEITGYLVLLKEEPKVVIKSNGINETILKYVTEEIMQNTEMISDIVEKRVQESMQGYPEGIYNMPNVENIYEDVMKMLEDNQVEFKNISNSNLSYTMIEFYTLIAMTCLYGGILGMTAINHNLANMGNVGKRTSITPTSKGKIIFSSLMASYLAQLIGLAILFVYTIFVLKVDYGTNLPLIVLLSLTGSLAGLSLGIAVATLIKANENAKIGILIAVTMLGCFLSGMMGITMKYMIDKNVPIVNLVNPASMITDGFYALYYYDTLDRYFLNIVSLLIFSGVMIILSINGLRKQKYEAL
ncbi:MAG: ABC transporter permease [Clostridia bacterium]|jgi:ABC-2 type transport system permease protein|nr:ABC transporter permease [Clostridia bacterium]MCI9246172.1 ABC transporter permease [Clostridia bacterium]